MLLLLRVGSQRYSFDDAFGNVVHRETLVEKGIRAAICYHERNQGRTYGDNDEKEVLEEAILPSTVTHCDEIDSLILIEMVSKYVQSVCFQEEEIVYLHVVDFRNLRHSGR